MTYLKKSNIFYWEQEGIFEHYIVYYVVTLASLDQYYFFDFSTVLSNDFHSLYELLEK